MYWHISWKVWFINLNVCCCNGCSCCWVNVNKSKKVSSLAAKIEYVIINSNWMHEIMAGRKKKFGYSSESPWFPESYFGWIIIGNPHHETSSIYPYLSILYYTILFIPCRLVAFWHINGHFDEWRFGRKQFTSNLVCICWKT